MSFRRFLNVVALAAVLSLSACAWPTDPTFASHATDAAHSENPPASDSRHTPS